MNCSLLFIFTNKVTPDVNISGDLKNEESVLSWLTHQVESDEIEDVTDEMLDMLIEKSPSLAALFCKLSSLQSFI